MILYFSVCFPMNSVPPHWNLRVAAVLRGILHAEAHVYHPTMFVTFSNEFCAAASESACALSPARNLAFRCQRLSPHTFRLVFH